MLRMERGPALRRGIWGVVASALLAFALLVPAQTSHAAANPVGWQSYTNPVYGYTISYPATWHRWDADPRLSQEISDYNEHAAGTDFPELGSQAKVEIDVFQKPASQDLTAWMAEKVDRPDLPDHGRPSLPDSTVRTRIAGMPTVVQERSATAPRSTTQFVDAGPAVFILSAVVSDKGDQPTAKQILDSFRMTGKLDLAHAAMPNEPLRGTRPKSGANPQLCPFLAGPQIVCGGGWSGLTLPLKIDYAWGGMPWLAMNDGGVNSWFDHNRPDYSTNGSLTRYDGQVLSNSGGCSLGNSCYDGHNGIDFSTLGVTGRPVYASDFGTVSTQYQTQGGNCIFVQSSGKANLSTQDCHLSSYVVTSGSVSQGQLIAYSGCTGTGCGGPHVHFGAYDTAVSPWPAVDPFGWSGSGSDPWGYDSGYNYMWTNNPPTFIGGSIYTVNPSLSSGWSYFTDGYGVGGYWAYSTAGGATKWADWWAPVSNGCYGLEVWVPAGNATANPAKYTIYFTNGSSTTVNVDQNDNTSWYTIYATNYNGWPISYVEMSNANGINGQQIAASQMWYSC